MVTRANENYLLSLSSLTLTATDCRVASYSDPIRGAVHPHAQHPVFDCRMIDLLDSGYTLPHKIKSVEPDLIFILQSVVVDIEFPDGRKDLLRRVRKIPSGRSGIPGCEGGGTAGKLAPLLNRNEGRGLMSCVLQRRRNNGRDRVGGRLVVGRTT